MDGGEGQAGVCTLEPGKEGGGSVRFGEQARQRKAAGSRHCGTRPGRYRRLTLSLDLVPAPAGAPLLSCRKNVLSTGIWQPSPAEEQETSLLTGGAAPELCEAGNEH